MHSKPSRTPGNVSHTVLYDAIFLPNGTACADLNCAGEARAMYKKPPLSQVLETTLMGTRTGRGLAARTGRGEISQAGKHTSSKRRYEYTTRNKMNKMLYFVETTHEVDSR